MLLCSLRAIPTESHCKFSASWDKLECKLGRFAMNAILRAEQKLTQAFGGSVYTDGKMLPPSVFELPVLRSLACGDRHATLRERDRAETFHFIGRAESLEIGKRSRRNLRECK
jgi:hypothetical protein